jgi:TrmH family RNA methyltransferase
MASKLITLVRNLQQRKGRKRSSLAVAEGVRLVEEAMQAGIGFQGAVFCSSLSKTGRGAALLADVAAHAILIEEVDERTFGDLAGTDTPQGILAVIEPPKWSLDTIEPRPRFPVLVVDGVQDPGNLGAILRTADGLGTPGVILLKGTADASNAKALRASMGATFRLPISRATIEELSAWACEREVSIWVAGADGTPLHRTKAPDKLAVVIGNEGSGVSLETANLACGNVSIPLARGAESLNVAVAAGIILYEVQRAS